MNLVFDLGGVVVRWDPDAIIAGVFNDPGTRAKVKAGVFEHPDWLELDRGTLGRDEAITRAAQRTGISSSDMKRLLHAVPPSLVVFADTVDLLRRLNGDIHMKVGQQGTARDGQHGKITEVYSNAVRFLSNSGAHFTLLNDEFAPAGTSAKVRTDIARRARALFGNLKPGDGFHFGYKRRRGGIVEAFVKRIPATLALIAAVRNEEVEA